MKYLVIVESPSKAKTIEKYLPKGYKVLSSVGHIRDLAKTGPGGLGVDVENEFEASYTYITGKKKIVNELKKAQKDTDFVYLATDPDREGEAISWHLAQELGLDINEENRVIFNEITKAGVQKGMENVRKIDMNLVNSQEGRRIIDRILGFKLSKLLQRKVKEKSAGRVQSVALRLIVEKEEEIRAFEPIEYYKINAYYKELILEHVNNDKKMKPKIAKEIFEKLQNDKKLLVSEQIKKEKKQNAYLPFTTSTLQQTASTTLNYPSRKTMQVAQKLYEGIELENGLEGLITYMRSDSTRLADDFVKSTKAYVDAIYGKEYVGVYRKTKAKANQQDAHEAIRPTNVNHTPEKMKKFLNNDQYKLYNLIYIRAVASLMKPAILETNTFKFMHSTKEQFKTSQTKILFEGYKKVYSIESKEEKKDLYFELNSEIVVDKFESKQHFTKPPARYSESKLIKELEEKGIGRPSTYASIIDVLKLRNYVDLENKAFVPTKSGELVIGKLKEFFGDFINVTYTNDMETKLDEIAEGEYDKIKLLHQFYDYFIPLLENADENMENMQAEKTGEKCPECGYDLVKRKGRYGEFIACSNYPECKYIKQDKQEVIAKCPKCKEGNIIAKYTKKKKEFYACDRFPKCDYAVWKKEDIGKEEK